MTKQATAQYDFAPGTSRHTRSVHSLALRIAEELDLQVTEEEEARRIARAERLRELRGARSQLWVANQLGVTPRAYQAWEAGGGISPENVEALAALHKIDEDYILYGNDRRPSPDQVTEMLNLLRSLDQRLARVEDLLAEQELADLERDAERGGHPKDKRHGKHASGDV